MSEAMSPQELERLRDLEPRGTDYTVAGYKALLAEVDRLTLENGTLFVDYSTEKTQHDLFEGAFAEVRADRDRLAARVTELEGELAQREDDVPARITAEMERDDARAMLRYCYKRWPSPIFWQAAAQIDNPYTALPEWLTEPEPTAAPDRSDRSGQ